MGKRTDDWLSDLAHAEEEHILQTTTGFYLDDFPELAVDELNEELDPDDEDIDLDLDEDGDLTDIRDTDDEEWY